VISQIRGAAAVSPTEAVHGWARKQVQVPDVYLAQVLLRFLLYMLQALRISMKLFNRTPADLPQDLKNQVGPATHSPRHTLFSNNPRCIPTRHTHQILLGSPVTKSVGAAAGLQLTYAHTNVFILPSIRSSTPAGDLLAVQRACWAGGQHPPGLCVPDHAPAGGCGDVRVSRLCR
jgi:hypothetical protein